MNEFFGWFGAHHVYYYLIALTALFAFVSLALSGRHVADTPRFEGVFLALAVLTLFAWRWPIFLAPFQLNPDESTWAAGAIKAMVDFAPWRGFDTGTSGPLNAYIVALPALFGAPITFGSGRVVATCLMGMAMIALYCAVKWTNGTQVARLSVLPPVVLLALTTDWDFVHYSSEHLAICLTTIVLAASAYLAKSEGSMRSRVIAGSVAGFCAGSALFAKFQAVPIAFVVFLFALAAVFSLWKRSKKEGRRAALALVGGLCAIPTAMMASLCWSGTLYDAYLSYIRLNIDYAVHGSRKLPLAYFLQSSRIYAFFMIASLLIIVYGATVSLRRGGVGHRAACVSVSSLVLLLTSLFVIYQPRLAFPHYLLFSIVPFSFCTASALGLARNTSSAGSGQRLFAILFASLFVIPALSTARSGNPFLLQLTYNLEHPRSVVADAISQYAKPGDPISVWGWASEYYVKTGTVTAAREAETAREIEPSPYRDYFRWRYLLDIQRRKPIVFVDAVSPTAFRLTDRASQGYEIFPELKTYIRENYELKEHIGGVRIFVEKPSDVVAGEQSSGSFKIDGSSESGMATFENDSDRNTAVNFSAEGKWSYASAGPFKGPAGNGDSAPRDFVLPGAPSFGLIARRPDGSFQFIGERAELTLKSHEVISFMMNDIVGGAADNRGSLNIFWTRK